MKISSKGTIWLAVSLICLATPATPIRITPPSTYQEYRSTTPRVIQNSPHQRLLTGGDGEDKAKMLDAFRQEVERFVKKEIKAYFTGAKVEGEKETISATINDTPIFSIAITADSDEEIGGEAVFVIFHNTVISSNVTLEKTALKDYVKVYLRLFLHNYFFKVKQVIFRLDEVATEVGQMLDFVCHQPSAEWKLKNPEDDPQPKQDERLLKADSRTLKTVLKSSGESATFDRNDINGPDFKLPLLKSVKVFPLQIKTVRYAPKDPQAIATILDRKLSSPFPRSKVSPHPGRKLLSKESPRYVAPKNKFFNEHELTSRQFIEFGLEEKPVIANRNEVEGVYFRLTPSRNGLTDVIAVVQIDNQTHSLSISFFNAAFYTKIDISIPTKRFVVKSILEEMDNMKKTLNIVDNLTTLREQLHSGDVREERKYVINEFLEPNYMYFMMEEEFHNITDGATYSDSNVDNVLIFKNEDPNGEHGWLNKVLQDVNGTQVERLRDEMEFEKFGEGFTIMRTTIKLKNLPRASEYSLGCRTIADNSMFNQNFLMLPFLHLQAEIGVQLMNIKIIRGVVFPFVTQALNYYIPDAIPDLVHGKQHKEVRNIKTIYDKGEVEMTRPGQKVEFQMCPIQATEHSFFVTFEMDRDGGNFKQFYSNKQYGIRPKRDVDYCSYINTVPDDANEDGGDERRVRKKVIILI